MYTYQADATCKMSGGLVIWPADGLVAKWSDQFARVYRPA
jgi:hypothetical protein